MPKAVVTEIHRVLQRNTEALCVSLCLFVKLCDIKNAAHGNEQHLFIIKTCCCAAAKLYYALGGGFFNFPFQTFLPCNLLTKYMMPAKMKKNGPKKPNIAMNLVP